VMVDIATGRREPFVMRATGRQNDVWKPIITAVNGTCVGGGLLFVSDSDIVICSTAASFTNPGVSLGIAAHVGAAVLTHTADFRAILKMTLLGRHGRVDAHTAMAAGIVSEIVAPGQLSTRALELAHMIASNSPGAVADALRTLWGSLGVDADGARQLANERAERFRVHPDAVEGVAAYREGRPPRWNAYRPSETADDSLASG
jgi:E-phenylitaconyl-CoA hydratase